MKILGRLIKISLPYWKWMIIASILSFLTIGSSIGLLMTSAYIIARAALHPSVADLQIAIVGVRFFGILRGIFRYLERLTSHESTFRILTNLRTYFYIRLEPLAPSRLMQYRSIDIFTQIIQNIQTLENFFIRILAPPFTAILVTLLMWILLGNFNPVLPLSVFMFQVIAGIGLPAFSYGLSRLQGKRLITLRTDLNSLIHDGIQGMADLVVFGQMEAHQQRIAKVNHELTRVQQRLARIRATHETLIGLLMIGAVISAMIVCVPLISTSRLDGVYLTVIILGIMASFEAYFAMPDVLYFWESNREAATRIFEIIDAVPEVKDPAAALPVPLTFDLRIEHLTFTYPNSATAVLKDINFRIPRGNKIAIVGQSGSGKSTLLSLLLRFWDHYQGEILFDGEEIRRFNQHELRSRFALVSQRSHLFNASVRDNLLLATDEADDQKLLNVLHAAQLHRISDRMENILDVQVGQYGMRLSGGERQRLIIAQAVLKNTPVMIFDEPTANLDIFTERLIMDHLLSLCQKKTLILITHRLIAMDKMDSIIVLHEGQIAESGRHEELLRSDGLYRRMWQAQQEMNLLHQFSELILVQNKNINWQ